MTEQDDMENWLYATAASRGTIARRHPFNYQMSMGAYKTNDPIPGDVSLQITDQIAAQLLSCLRVVSGRRAVG